MESPSFAPASAGCQTTHRLRPSEVETEFFEFFPKSSRREVLLLGDVVDLLVHYLPGSRRKKLCASEVGPCDLCDLAATSPDVEACQAEYYAPAFVRRPREREFRQRVAVYPAVSAVMLQELFPLGSMRGKRVEVHRKPSRMLEYKALGGIPRGLPAVLPAAFDVLPFIRARYGLPEEPGRPLVVLAPLRCEPDARPGDRPARLTLNVRDFDDLAGKSEEELRQYLAKCEERGFHHQAARTRELLATKFAPPAVTVPPAAVPPAQDRIRLADLTVRPELVEGVNAQVGPRHLVQAAITPELEEEALEKRSAESVCGDFRGRMSSIKAKREQEAAAKPPGAVGELVDGILGAVANGTHAEPSKNGTVHPAKKGGGR